jgi:hypothetical protein
MASVAEWSIPVYSTVSDKDSSAVFDPVEAVDSRAMIVPVFYSVSTGVGSNPTGSNLQLLPNATQRSLRHNW